MKINNVISKNVYLVIMFGVASFFLIGCSSDDKNVKDVIDNLVSEFYSTMDEGKLDKLTTVEILDHLSTEDIKIISTKYWMFDANVPTVVSIMQDQSQRTEPFWLKDAGFSKTDMLVENEHSKYTVWQKSFEVGRISLGINGFDKHRPHYFVSIKPQNPSDDLILANFYPQNQHVSVMDSGSFTYHDWDELILSKVPESLKGGKLLTTIRGRAREAHLINAFRKTKYPSSNIPDQVMLTWSKDPQTTQSIQWRTHQDVKEGVVSYWKDGTDSEKDFMEVKAELNVLEDRLLQNDRYIHRYTAFIKDLIPGSKYHFKVGDPSSDNWSKPSEFITAPEKGEPFSFTYFGDTHKSPHWGQLINAAYKKYPTSAFYSIGGDIVSTGLYRDEWDQLFEYSSEVISNRPLMSTLGNHDSQDGLGYWMYTQLFDLPKNGSDKIPIEGSYSFEYSNALFLMLDATSSKIDQAIWLEDQLKNSTSTWKFAMFHFPPYSYEEDYPVIRKEWGDLFDKYHVDMVFSGHVHYYMRSKPMYNQKPVKSPADGTIYVISIAVPNRDKEMPEREFVQVRFGGDYLYQNIQIDGNTLVYKAINQDGIEKDSFIIKK